MSRILVDQVRSNSASGDAITLDGNGKCAINATTINSLTFPTSDGSADQLLKTNGSGALSFGTVSAGITMAQQWRLTSVVQGNQTPLTNWEAIDRALKSEREKKLTDSQKQDAQTTKDIIKETQDTNKLIKDSEKKKYKEKLDNENEPYVVKTLNALIKNPTLQP